MHLNFYEFKVSMSFFSILKIPGEGDKMSGRVLNIND